MKWFIGLDPSTNFGYAAVAVDLVSHAPHIIHSKVLTAPKGKDGLERAMIITNQVFELIEELHGEKYIAMEGYSFGNSNRTIELVTIGTMMRYTLIKAGHEKNTIIVPPTSLKKFVTGKGNSDKKRVILDAHKHWGFDLHDDNQCDAACLAIIAAAHVGEYQQKYMPKSHMKDPVKVSVCN